MIDRTPINQQVRDVCAGGPIKGWGTVHHGWHRSMALKRGSSLVKVLPAEKGKRGAYLTTSISIGRNPMPDN